MCRFRRIVFQKNVLSVVKLVMATLKSDHQSWLEVRHFAFARQPVDIRHQQKRTAQAVAATTAAAKTFEDV